MSNSEPLILAFPDYPGPAARLAARLGWPLEAVALHRFPDGEALVRLPPELPETVVMVRSLDRPDPKLVELLLAAETARTLGAKRVILVAPYLCYMRQDRAFHPGEAVSQRVVGRWLAGLFDGLLTVDPHLHRTPRLEDAVPARAALAVHATEPLGRLLAARPDRPLLLGPDAESAQWVAAIAQVAGLPHAVARKTRHGDTEVTIRLPEDIDWAGRPVVLVDDVASSGATLATVAHQLRALGAGPIDALVTHALLAPGAEARLRAAGLRQLWSSDSLLHPSNVAPLDGLLAEALTHLLARLA